MGLDYDPKWYEKVIYACALNKDFELFNSGDETLVGDRGITLSGGQKARISLARAVYTQREIILLDDPLSAVDAEVSNIIFTECIQKLLKNKTVLLVTHQVSVLSQANKILVLHSGRQIFYGSYDSFLQRSDAIEVIGEMGFEKKNIKVEAKAAPDKAIKPQDKIKIDEEEIIRNMSSAVIYWRYFKYGFKSGFVLILVVLLLLISQAAYLSLVYWPTYWSKQSEEEQENDYYLEIFGMLVGMLYFVGIFRYLTIIHLSYLANKNMHNNGLKV